MLFADLAELIQSFTPQDIAGVLFRASVVSGATWTIAALWYRSSVRYWRRESAAASDRAAGLSGDLESERRTTARQRREVEQHATRLAEREKYIAEREKHHAEVKRKLLLWHAAYTKLKPAHDQAVAELADARKLIDRLTAETGDAGARLKVMEEELAERQKRLDQTDRRIQAALKLRGNLWAAKALQRVPKFRPLAERKRAVISVLNLKGGVGKTTITAHLGIALARRGYRVLLVDLDLQGSLSDLLLRSDALVQFAAQKQLVQHYFEKASAGHKANLIDYIHTVFEIPESRGRISLIGASDELAYAELSLTLRWLLRAGQQDTRFLLRRGLHRLAAKAGHDIILIDCPPLVNISCMNALAASDYVLTPVMLGGRAIERVPVLLKKFLQAERFQKHINHSLKVLGLVANRTHRDQLTAVERDGWERLATWCRDVSGLDVKRFETVVPQQTKDLREIETVVTLPDPQGRLAQVFAALAAEVEQELPNECRRGSATLS